jgi:hypothetical protein
MASASKIPGARRYNPANTNRSQGRKTDLFANFGRSTLICCRRTRISASSRTFEKNNLVSTVHSSMRASTIGHEHHPICPASQPYRVSDKDRVGREVTRRNIRWGRPPQPPVPVEAIASLDVALPIYRWLTRLENEPRLSSHTVATYRRDQWAFLTFSASTWWPAIAGKPSWPHPCRFTGISP